MLNYQESFYCRISDVAKATDDGYTEEEIQKMELRICKVLTSLFGQLNVLLRHSVGVYIARRTISG